MLAALPTSAIPASQHAPQFVGGGRIEWRDRPVPRPGAEMLLVRVRANALCGTDREQLASGSPVTPGHEVVGDVTAAGEGTRTPVGTRGAVYLMDYCDACATCREGATNLCAAKRADLGFTVDGGYGAYVLVRQSQFFEVDLDLDPSEATLLLDTMGTSRHALDRAQLVAAEIRTLLVAGGGPVGLGVAAMARLLLGPSTRIVVGDVVDYRLALARRLGVASVDLRRDDFPEGADAAIDASGRESARRALLDALAPRGVLVCVGHGEGLSLQVSRDLIAPERAVLGSEYFPYRDLAANIEILREHRTYLAQVITHRLPIDRLAEAYALFASGECGKVVVVQ
jgi:threonine 3-dehydrogenase